VKRCGFVWSSSWRSSTADLKNKILHFIGNNSRRRFGIIVLSHPVFFFGGGGGAKHATLWHTCPFIHTDTLNKYYKSTTLKKIYFTCCLYSSNTVTMWSSDLINSVIFLIRRQNVFSSSPRSKPEYCHFVLSQRAPALSFKKALIMYILLMWYIRHLILVNGTPLCYEQNIRQKMKGWLFHQHVTLW